MSWLEDLVADGQVSYGIVQPGAHQNDGVPIVRAGDVREGRIDTSRPLRVAPEVSARHDRTVLVGGELLFTLVGSVGETALVPKSLAGWNVARAVAVLRPIGVDARWLHYALNSQPARRQINSLLNTTVQPTLNLADLKRLTLPASSLQEQQAIAEVLGALDDKIAANTALISQLDAIMHLTFRGLAKASAAPLSTTAEFVNGKAFTKGASGSGRVVVRIAELNGGISGSTVYSDAIVDDKHVARPGDILFAWSGSLTLHRWFRGEAIVNQHIFKVIPREGFPTWLVYELLRHKLADFKAIAADKATTMGHIQRHHLDEVVAVPVASEVQRVDALMNGLWARALGAERESLTLAETRDALLPQLMSGKLRVRDAERIAVDAGL
ncbi:restriction endonuclease subunit S [Microbacterium lushaniae]|uniref:restriction endonuclease subunit S n=1 Tax=Microbacterium lushaniae TaxID=2614639 RepID=UPI001783656E|nr:restriction endonuclease subunit S [Microbacterium lushaniae]